MQDNNGNGEAYKLNLKIKLKYVHVRKNWIGRRMTSNFDKHYQLFLLFYNFFAESSKIKGFPGKLYQVVPEELLFYKLKIDQGTVVKK